MRRLLPQAAPLPYGQRLVLSMSLCRPHLFPSPSPSPCHFLSVVLSLTLLPFLCPSRPLTHSSQSACLPACLCVLSRCVCLCACPFVRLPLSLSVSVFVSVSLCPSCCLPACLSLSVGRGGGDFSGKEVGAAQRHRELPLFFPFPPLCRGEIRNSVTRCARGKLMN